MTNKKVNYYRQFTGLYTLEVKGGYIHSKVQLMKEPKGVGNRCIVHKFYYL